MFSSLLHKYLGVQVLGHKVDAHLILQEVFQSVCTIYISTSNVLATYGSSRRSTSSLTFGIASHLNFKSFA